MISLTQKDIDRFWGRVDKEKSTTFYNGTRCWEWQAHRNNKGYGQLSIGGRAGRPHPAHRVSWTITFGEIPDRLFVLHHCDNTSCVRPEHLFLGTPQDNTDDMVGKGRQSVGERHGNHKLNEAEVAEIRRRYGRKGVGGEDSTRLSKEFGVSSSRISYIVNNKSWVKK